MTFGRDGQPATTVAKTVDIGHSPVNRAAACRHDSVTGRRAGHISVQTAPFPFEADRLRFAIWRSMVPAANGG